MSPALFLYGSITVAVALCAAGLAVEIDLTPKGRRKAARVAFASPAWPVMLVWVTAIGVRNLWRIARGREA